MSEGNGVQRELGYHDAKIESLEKQMGFVLEKLDLLISRSEQQKGGAKALVAAATIGGSVGAAIVKAIAYLKGSP